MCPALGIMGAGSVKVRVQPLSASLLGFLPCQRIVLVPGLLWDSALPVPGPCAHPASASHFLLLSLSWHSSRSTSPQHLPTGHSQVAVSPQQQAACSLQQPRSWQAPWCLILSPPSFSLTFLSSTSCLSGESSSNPPSQARLHWGPSWARGLSFEYVIRPSCGELWATLGQTGVRCRVSSV